MTEATADRANAAATAAPTERGWGKLLLALAAFFLLPATSPHLRAMLPVDQTITLFVPALAACMLVGWWAGGKLLPAVAWGVLALLVAMQTPALPGSFVSLARGWCLLLAAAFGLVCLFGAHRPFFSRALTALTIVVGVVLVMGAVGPVAAKEAQATVSAELSRRAADSMAQIRRASGPSGLWERLVGQAGQGTDLPTELERQLGIATSLGTQLFPALLGLESLCALALAWATYHRLSRARLGAPLAPLLEFRFNDQLVWGPSVGLAIGFLPTFDDTLRPLGRNLLVFFGVLYALRGFAVLFWLRANSSATAATGIGCLMLFLAVVTFPLVVVAALGLGLGDTWADWRRRARPTS